MRLVIESVFRHAFQQLSRVFHLLVEFGEKHLADWHKSSSADAASGRITRRMGEYKAKVRLVSHWLRADNPLLGFIPSHQLPLAIRLHPHLARHHTVIAQHAVAL